MEVDQSHLGLLLAQLRVNGKSAQQELETLEAVCRKLLPIHPAVEPSLEEDLEQEWLEYATEDLAEEDPFPCKIPENVLSKQGDLNSFTYYIFERRFGWSETEQKLKARKAVATEDAQFKYHLNDILDEYIKWYQHQKVSESLLQSFQYCITEAHNKPVVRNQVMVHLMEWFKIQGPPQEMDLFNMAKNLILLGLCDVWSAIRNACVSRLSLVMEHFTITQLHSLFTELVKICQSEESSWQSIEGAVMGINSLVRRFRWIGLVPEECEAKISESPDASTSVGENGTSASPQAEYFLQFGQQELRGIPEFITSHMRQVIFPLLAHPQLSVRENAIKAFSSYLSRCEFKEALSSFREVVERLCRGTESLGSPTRKSLPHLTVLKPDFQFMHAYEAEGLLGVCVFLVKHIPPGYFLPSWPLYFSTFSLYLMHPASTVRQATSTIFKFLVAKDSHNPVILKLVLQGLSQGWSVNWELLTQPHNPAMLSSEPNRASGVERRGSTKRSHIKVLGRRTTITKMGASDLLNEESHISDAWEWREGRLLAYELILKFLIKNHWLYTFGPHNLSVQSMSESGSLSAREPHTSDQHNDESSDGKSAASYGGSSLSQALHRTYSDKHPQGKPGSHNKLVGSPLPGGVEELPEISEAGYHGNNRPRRNSLTSSTSPAWDIPHNPAHGRNAPGRLSSKRHRRGRYSISTSSPARELPPPPVYFKKKVGWSQGRQATQANSPAAASDPSSASAQLYNKLPTIAGFNSPSLKTLVRHYSYYTQGAGLQGTAKIPEAVGRATSLLMHTLANDTRISKSGGCSPLGSLTKAVDNKVTSPNGSTQHCDIIRSCVSPSPLNSGSPDSDWIRSTEMMPFSELLSTMLYQTIESLADPRWELRRMGQQLLPCVAEVVRWYDMHLLEELWNRHLTPSASLLSYGATQALKCSLAHAAKLLPLLQNPPPSWQDHEMCRQVVKRITVSMSSGLPSWSTIVHRLLQRPSYDKLTVEAIELLMLAHSSFNIPAPQKESQIRSVVLIMQEVFKNAHPETKLAQEHSAARALHKIFSTPTEGFLSCCMKADGLGPSAQQVEKLLLEGVHGVLTGFLQSSVVQLTAPLLPILCHHVGWYANEDTFHKMLLDSVSLMTGKCNDYLNKQLDGEEKSRVEKHTCQALRELATAVTYKAVDLSLLRQVLDLYRALLSHVPASRHLPFILQAIVARINNVEDFRAETPVFSADDCDSVTAQDLAILSNDIPHSPIPNLEEISSEEEDEVLGTVAPVDSMLQESQILNTSNNSGGNPSSGVDGRITSPSLTSEAGSDWDSWSDDEEEDQSALSEVFSEFLHKLKNHYRPKTVSGKLPCELNQEIKRLPSRDTKLLNSIMQNF